MIWVLISLLGYTQALRPGVKASFGLAIDTQKLNDVAPTGPAHKVRHHVTKQFTLPLTSLPGWRQLHFRSVDE